MTDEKGPVDGFRVHFKHPSAKSLFLKADTVDDCDVQGFVEETFSMWEIDLGRPDDLYYTEIHVAARNVDAAKRKGQEYTSDEQEVQNRPVPRGPPLISSIEEVSSIEREQ